MWFLKIFAKTYSIKANQDFNNIYYGTTGNYYNFCFNSTTVFSDLQIEAYTYM